MERLDALKRLPKNQDPTKQFAIGEMEHLFISAGLEDLEPKIENSDDPKAGELQPIAAETVGVYPEILLEAEWKRQSDRFIELGFHTELDLTRDKYLESLPKFTPQPESFKGRLDIPMLVETRVSVKRQCELAGINYFLEELHKSDWPNDPQKYITPNTPYAVWNDEGSRNMNRKVEDVRKELAPDERGGTEFDGVALYIAKPHVLQTRFLDLPGTAVESAFAPCLVLWFGRPGLRYSFAADAHPRFGSLVCGRQK